MRTGFPRFCASLSVLVWLFVLTTPRAMRAADNSCDGIIATLNSALAPGICQTINPGNACYGSTQVSAQPTNLNFNQPGRSAGLIDLRSLQTRSPNGASLMMANSSTGPVKIIIFGNSKVQPGSGTVAGGQVFTMRWTGGAPVCAKTPSGMMLQTPSGQTGTITVNGVTIKLGSTAFIVVEGDLLFDQDPRIDRRQGQRNPNAPLCSGFDSDCDFGNCPVNARLVWGPYCREDSYSAMRPGLYRVILQGTGPVTAGATDFGPAHELFAYAKYDLNLPASYTFCWPGRPQNGTGLETIVLARSREARVNNLTLEYLSENCTGVRMTASNNAAPLSLMTVYNIEGIVEVTAGETSYTLAENEKVRIYFGGGAISRIEPPLPAGPVPTSTLVDWLTYNEGGLPSVNSERESLPSSPIVTFGQISLRDDNSDEIIGLLGEVTAYDPDLGDSNGTGIATADFAIFDERGILVHETREESAPYCAFGADSSCNAWVFAEQVNVWPGGQAIRAGYHTIQATATTQRGQVTTIEESVYIEPVGDSEGPQIGDIEVFPTPENGTLCAYNSITFAAAVNDSSGVSEVILWFYSPSSTSDASQVTYSGSEDNGIYYVATNGEHGPGQMDYFMEAVDTLGNVSRTASQTVALVDCVQIN